LNVVGKNPWEGPELKANPDQTFDLLRETKHMINSLQDKEKKLKAEVQRMYDNGDLAHLVDAKDSQKFNGDGISVAICKGKAKRVYEDEVQKQIDDLQQQIDKVKYVAERKQQFTEETGRPFWRVTLQAEL